MMRPGFPGTVDWPGATVGAGGNMPAASSNGSTDEALRQS